MLKDKVVETLGQDSLLMPAWITSALLANDRIKLYLSIIQSAQQHAENPSSAIFDWRGELTRAGLKDFDWLIDLIKTATIKADKLILSDFQRLIDALATDMKIMSRPICDTTQNSHQELTNIRDEWIKQLESYFDQNGISREMINALTHGDRKSGISFHLLVMDLHKELNKLSATLSNENIDGAHVWSIQAGDRPLIKAFMSGIRSTEKLKFTHPGLDTAVTRSDQKLLIQNDIGTNDAHVLVIEIVKRTITLTYSDLHSSRFGFFVRMLENIGFVWEIFDPVLSNGLNAGKPYQVGKATLSAKSSEDLLNNLNAIASRIVFVIDWNHARKRLQLFVPKAEAIRILQYSSDHNFGHMGWLLAGGEQLIYEAMQSVDNEVFKIGCRLDDVLGPASAKTFLIELLRIASHLLLQNLPKSLVLDSTRVLLTDILKQRTFEFDLIAEHAAYCHALCEGLGNLIDNDTAHHPESIAAIIAQSKSWEQRADQQLILARKKAARQSRWQPISDLLERADDFADAIEEAIFVYGLTLHTPQIGLPTEVRVAIAELTAHTLAGIQDYIKAIEYARHLHTGQENNKDQLLHLLWKVFHAEQLCDESLRLCRIAIIQVLYEKPIEYSLANELVSTIESATDSLLATSYCLKDIAFPLQGSNT